MGRMNKAIKYIVLFGYWLLALGYTKAQDSKSLFQTANSYYQNKQYEEAEKMYTLLLKKDKNNANAYYNLGNTYYHLKNYTNAILNYEKAKKLQPDNKYVAHNIELTNNKQFSKIEFSKEFFVTKQLKNVVHTRSSGSWSVFMLIALWISITAFCIHFFTTNKFLYRTGVLFFMATIIFSGFTYSSFKSEHQHNFAIVMQTNAFIKSAPVESMNAAQAVQTGIKVEIIDTDKNWLKIKLPNDKTGWIEKSSVEMI